MLLKEIVEKRHFNFVDRIDSWEESIRIACKPLEADGTVEPVYAEEIIKCVKKHGPYIVLIPNFAMPHSCEGAIGAKDTAISFMKVTRPVSFDPGDPEKDATVFFTLASVNSDIHLKNMRKLFTMLTNEELCAELLGVTGPEDLLRLDEKYSFGDAARLDY
ncbi:MAG: PTS sugar transporter subunit IIA [Synergistaceae bacterium]|jgi:PTS system ascorbate-specific IIA component|nr:PTS sugar transporter subunit IIA [Synergistaceae bacterium]